MKVHDAILDDGAAPALAPGRLAPLERLAAGLNGALMAVSAVALLAAAAVLTQSVVVRYFLRQSTDWQDETSVMLLVCATFLSAAQVQARRGHVGIEALAGLLSPRVDRAMRMLVDAASLAFCAFFAWKSWTLAHEAWVEGTVTSSTFAPPLALPYGTMALGMTLLAAQIALQLGSQLAGRRA